MFTFFHCYCCNKWVVKNLISVLMVYKLYLLLLVVGKIQIFWFKCKWIMKCTYFIKIHFVLLFIFFLLILKYSKLKKNLGVHYHVAELCVTNIDVLLYHARCSYAMVCSTCFLFCCSKFNRWLFCIKYISITIYW